VVTGTQQGKIFRRAYARRSRQLELSTKYKQQPSVSAQRWNRKVAIFHQSTSNKAKQSYGPEAIDVEDDVSSVLLLKQQDDIMANHINISATSILDLEAATKNQSQSGLLHGERRRRITASTIVSGEEESVNSSSADSCTTPSGAIVTLTPDCIRSVSHCRSTSSRSPRRTLVTVQGNSASRCTMEIYNLYYYKCQGLLNVCDINWLNFVVRTVDPYQLHIERICRDQDMWDSTMFPKLKSFYDRCLLL
jgi:hypothetical protein